MVPGEEFKQESKRTIEILLEISATIPKIINQIHEQQQTLKLFKFVSLETKTLTRMFSSISTLLVFSIQADFDSRKSN